MPKPVAYVEQVKRKSTRAASYTLSVNSCETKTTITTVISNRQVSGGEVGEFHLEGVHGFQGKGGRISRRQQTIK